MSRNCVHDSTADFYSDFCTFLGSSRLIYASTWLSVLQHEFCFLGCTADRLLLIEDCKFITRCRVIAVEGSDYATASLKAIVVGGLWARE